MQGFIFGGTTGKTYEDLQRQRRIIDVLAKGATQTPKTAGEGLAAIGRALAFRALQKKSGALESKLQGDADAIFQAALGGQIGSPYTGTNPKPESPNTGDPRRGMFATDSETTDDLGRYGDALASIESGGRYDAIGPDTGKGRAYGKYQVMDFNVGPWTEKYYGKALTPDEFLNNPEAQDAVFRGEFGSYVSKYGNPQDAASVWFSGRPMEDAGNSSDGYNTVPQYVRKFNDALGLPQGGTSAPSVAKIAAALGNPMIASDPGKKAILTALMGRAMNASDPAYQADLAYRKAQTEKLLADVSGDGAQTEYGLSPQFGVDADGNPVMLQVGRNGTAVQTEMPEGVALRRDPIKVDAGTDWILLDPITRQPIGQVSKNLGEAEAAKVSGRTTGETTAQAQVDLPAAEDEALRVLGLISDVQSSPALAGITGMIQGRLPPMTQAGTDLLTKIDQLKGKAFMEAYKTLKGGGQITEIEGKKAEEAQTRLNRAQSAEEYIRALGDMAELVASTLGDTRQKAGALAPQTSMPPPMRPDVSQQSAMTPTPDDIATMSESALNEYLASRDISEIPVDVQDAIIRRTQGGL